MKWFLALLMVVSSPAWAVTPTNAPSVMIGGSGADAAPSLVLSEYSMGYSSPYFTISSGGATGADQCAPFVRDGAPYQVPVGKVALCYGPNYSSSTSSTWIQTMSTTGTFGLGSCPTANVTYQGGASTRYVYPIATGFTNYTRHDLIVFSSGRWPGVQYNQGASAIFGATLTCREVQ